MLEALADCSNCSLRPPVSENCSFAIDILACPDCGGRLRFVATIGERALIEKILGHLGLPIDLPAAAPARQAAWLPGFEPAGGWLPD